ncbi:MAG: ISNCY family transposase [Lachnospiraceae bacterium]
MDEQKKYEVIKRLVDENGNKERAALTLGITKRQVYRLIKVYREKGKAGFVHGNRGRKPVSTIPDATRQLVLDLYKTKYSGANFTHFTELLERIEGIKLSVTTVTSILEEDYILSPRVTKAKQKRKKKELKAKQAAAKSKKESDQLQANLVAVEDAHSRRPRCAYLGELEQMDASAYEWFGTGKTTLHIAVDDASGAITGAWFDEQETLSGYYHVFHEILVNYGIPYRFFTDRRTVFTYQKKNSSSIEEDTYTQFAYACKQLGVEIDVSSVPQAKGRVERMFETLQSRLPVELRLAGVTTIEAANEFLNSYIKEFNAKFALPIDSIKSVFEAQPSNEKINLTLAVLTQRTVDSGHCIQFKKQHYRMLNSYGIQTHYRKGTKVMVIQAYDGSLYCNVNDKDIYALEAIPEHEEKSRNFDDNYEKPVPQKRKIPSMNHPWRSKTFWKFVKAQEHHWNDDIPA